jgi:hypothetical protein
LELPGRTHELFLSMDTDPLGSTDPLIVPSS